MKLISLKLQNFTSYLGNHYLDFQDIAKNNLFAISGQTGSGKSSILNAISLSLYGQSYKKSLNNFDFVTQGKDKSEIILEFSINQDIYTAIWACKIKKKTGENLKRPLSSRKLLRNNDLIEENIEKIIGLDFSQFCKTVILNQGEFSKFLLSSFSQRKEILEKLYQDKTLKQMQVELRSEIQDSINKTNSLKQSIETLDDNLDKETCFEHEIKKAESNKNKISNQTNEIERNISITKDIKSLLVQRCSDEKKNIETTEDARRIINDLNSIKIQYAKSEEELKKFIKLKDYKTKQFSEIRNTIEKYNDLNNLLLKSISKDQSLRKSIQQLNKSIGETQIDITKLITNDFTKIVNIDELENMLINFNPLLEKQVSYDQRKKDIEKEINKHKELITNYSKTFKLLAGDKERFDIEELKHTEKDLKAKLITALSENKVLNDKLNSNLKKIESISNSTTEFMSINEETKQLALQFISNQSIESAKNLQSGIEKFVDIHTLKELITVNQSLENSINKNNQEHEDIVQKLAKLNLFKEQNEQRQKEKDTLITKLQSHRELLKEKQELKQQLYDQNIHLMEDLTHTKNSILNLIGKTKLDVAFELKNIKNIRLKENYLEKKQILESSIKKEELAFNELKGYLASLKSDIGDIKDKIDKKYLKKPSLLDYEIREVEETFKTLEFNNKENLKNLRIKESKVSRINGQKQQIKENILLTTERLLVDYNIETKNTSIAELEILLESIKLSLDELITREKEQKQKLQIVQQNITKLQTKQAEQNKIKNQIKKLKNQLKEINKNNKDKNNLLLLIGKDQFRNFVLEHIEKQLVFLANKELRNLYQARYQIIESESQQDFYISDNLNGNQKRKASTLSGGETFLVSLALALGLSELSKGGANIQSFFIDEGFGTLDQDSLNDVIDVLHELKNRGKQIGVISHVESLNSRFTNKIILSKNHLGFSSVSHLH